MGKFLLWVTLGVMPFQVPAYAVYKGQKITQENSKYALSTVQIEAYSHRPAAHVEACTGTLIAENIILTAAHCFVDSEFTQFDPTRLGSLSSILDIDGNVLETVQSENILLFPDAEKEQISMAAEDTANYLKMIRSSTYKEYSDLALNYKKRLSSHDIAVIILSKPFTTPHKIAKIYDETLQVGDTLTFAGYGDTDYIPPSGDDFDHINKPLQLTEITVQEFKDAGAIVAGKNDSRCMVGDSGGPAYVEKDGELYVAMTVATTFLEMLEDSWLETKNDGSLEKELEIARKSAGVSTMMNLSNFKDFFASAQTLATKH